MYNFIVAQSHQAANITAVEQGWELIITQGKRGWKNKEGEWVEYAHYSENLAGRGAGTRVYLGHKWYRNLLLGHNFLEEMQRRRINIVPLGGP